MKQNKILENIKNNDFLTPRDKALEAIKTILEYIGEDPSREGLKNTPQRVIKSYEELFSGYKQNPNSILNTKFFETANFNDLVLLKNIKFKSVCEHHMLPIIGYADIAYIPDGAVVGISKIARLVEIFSRRLQIQEKMTSEIGESLQDNLKPKGVAVKISAVHYCMKMRGVLQDDNIMQTTHYTGIFVQEQKFRDEFLSLTNYR